MGIKKKRKTIPFEAARNIYKQLILLRKLIYTKTSARPMKSNTKHFQRCTRL